MVDQVAADHDLLAGSRIPVVGEREMAEQDAPDAVEGDHEVALYGQMTRSLNDSSRFGPRMVDTGAMHKGERLRFVAIVGVVIAVLSAGFALAGDAFDDPADEPPRPVSPTATRSRTATPSRTPTTPRVTARTPRRAKGPRIAKAPTERTRMRVRSPRIPRKVTARTPRKARSPGSRGLR